MKNKIIIPIISALLFTACSDFLDIRPEGTVPSTGLDYTKTENIFKPVSAAYASLRENGHEFSYIGAFEITSDDADKGSTASDNPETKQFDQFTYDASNSLIASLWTGYYNIVSAANNAIYQMPLFEEQMGTEDNKEYTRQCAAEAKVIRAYAYFNLTRLFGSVPIIDTIMTSDDLSSKPQATKSELYAFIEKDLQEAIPLLPSSYAKSWAGRLTNYSAMGIKAKVHMYHAALENSAANWDSVAVLTDKIMASGKFDLLSDFRSVFSIDEENSKESLFEIQSSTFGNSSGEDTYTEYAYVQGPRGNSPSNMQGWGFCTPSNSLINFFTTRNDSVRALATFLYRGTMTPEGDSIKTACTNPVYNGKVYTPSEYNNWNYNGYGFDYNIRILRYSDILLMFAEAKQNGSTLGNTSGFTALSAINKVRERVSLDDLESLSLQDIWDERRAELALEEDRFFDLVRTGQASSVLSSLGYVEGKNNVFPIPATQLQLNTSLNQNPNY
ncbi:MAG: RagB/SusD family nutrient uptake outer membrane protein [Paludibacter sp.]|nr:RagB/SusD family nutrient uptake outer membrane protein [Paludibacter sp.]